MLYKHCPALDCVYQLPSPPFPQPSRLPPWLFQPFGLHSLVAVSQLQSPLHQFAPTFVPPLKGHRAHVALL